MKIVETPIVIKFQEIKSPYTGAVRGMRIVAAIANLAGRDFKGNEVPTFRKPYWVADAAYTCPADAERFAETLHKQHYKIVGAG